MALRMNDKVVAILEYFKYTRTIEYTNNRIYYTIIIRIYHCAKMSEHSYTIFKSR